MLKPLLIEGIQPGGQMTITRCRELPGLRRRDPGPVADGSMRVQAMHVGTEIVADHIEAVDLKRQPFWLKGDSGTEYTATPLSSPPARKPAGSACPLRSASRAMACSACATCDGFFFRGKNVIVIGGGNTAVEEALYLANIAARVTLVHRRGALRAEKILQERLFANPKIEVVWNSELAEVLGHEDPRTVTGARLRSTLTGDMTTVPADGVFIAIGHVPQTELFKDQIEMKPSGYIKTAPYSTATNIPGVYAAGDVADDIYRQAVTAAGMGCMAALDAERHLAGLDLLHEAAE